VAGAGKAGRRSIWPTEDTTKAEDTAGATLDLAGGGCGRGGDNRTALDLAGRGCGRGRDGQADGRSRRVALNLAGAGTDPEPL
jgi:hypothetical protein